MTTIYMGDKTALPERKKNDLYRTERTLIDAFFEEIGPTSQGFDRILDPGAGDGRWGQIAGQYFNASLVAGVELEHAPKPEGFNIWYPDQDFLTWEWTDKRFDLIVGNPPYFLAEEFIRKSWDLLDNYGVVAFLLRTSFMEGVNRYNNLWADLYPYRVYVCSRRPSFYGGKTNGTSFSIFIWSKDGHGHPHGDPRMWSTRLLLHERDKNHAE